MQAPKKHVLDLLLEKYDITGMSVLDVGCGHGRVARTVLDAGAETLHGIDIRQYAIDEANKAFKGLNEYDVHFWVGNAGKYPEFFEDKRLFVSYDIVLIMGVVHHLPYIYRNSVCRHLLAMTKKIFVIRTGDNFMKAFRPHDFNRMFYRKTPHNGTQGVYFRANIDI
jgi:2-polyprenyl-3-methyl-5-hydroxy-6-metoxy-1,4-benzoquinol methylase